MKIKYFEKDIDEIEVLITGKNNDELQHLFDTLKHLTSNDINNRVILKTNDKIIVREIKNIDYFIAEGNNVFAVIDNQKLKCQMRLYEVEKYSSFGFIRVSKSIVININFIDYLEAEFSGNYVIYTLQSNKIILARSYVNKFMKYVEKGGHEND